MDSIALFSTTGLLFLLRWFHFFFGIIWIGLLYYFNFVQGAFFAETDANTKTACTQKLVPRALWWFRWGAMITFLTGWTMILIEWSNDAGILMSPWGVFILSGAILGTLMWANVWFVIWPNQKLVIQNALSGGVADAAARAARATVASRTNVMFSIPLLFFMGAARHLPLNVAENAKMHMPLGIVLVIALALEVNALKGKTGPMTTIKGVIHCGFALAAVLYAVIEVCL
jgi:uncharacterized membrane protein